MNLAQLRSITITIGLVLSFSLHATSNQFTHESIALLEQLQGNIQGTLLAVAENENRKGHKINDLHYLLESPPRQMTNLGLVLDVDSSNDSYEVLSVTPGSMADQLAIKSGDQVLAINDIKINKATNKKMILQLNSMVAGQALKLALNSNGQYKEVSSTITGQYMPGFRFEIGTDSRLKVATNIDSDNQACGEVSIFYEPPETKNLYRVTFNKIDKDHLKRDRYNFRLPVGKHTIYLHEQIDDPVFPVQRRGSNRTKTIEIDVKQDVTYHLGAKYIRKYRLNSFNGKYWEPVVWKTSDDKCKL